jgi:hypothetical protein
MLRIFIGFDGRFPEPSRVLEYSLRKHASVPIHVQHLDLVHLERVYGFQPDPDPKATTEHTYSRFLVPYLCGYQGKAVFMDNDMLCLGDVKELDELPMSGLALRVRQHDYQPPEGVKMYGVAQQPYYRKLWSSLMIMNCGQLQLWTKHRVETAGGKFLHRFEGIDDRQIGAIPEGWNDLEGQFSPQTKLLHWTEGNVWNNTLLGNPDKTWPHQDVWLQARQDMYAARARNII